MPGQVTRVNSNNNNLNDIFGDNKPKPSKSQIDWKIRFQQEFDGFCKKDQNSFNFALQNRKAVFASWLYGSAVFLENDNFPICSRNFLRKLFF